MIGDGVLIDLRQRTLLGADRGREIAEVVSGQRNVAKQRLSDRFAVVPDFGER
jgi:hypothetical protein